MSAFPFKDFSVIVFLFIFVVFVESQDFCESYKRNNYSMIVFSHSNDTLLLIVDKHFWRLRENDIELVFDRKDFQASNSSEQWVESNYTFAWTVYDPTDKSYRGIALFRDQNKITKGTDINGNPVQSHYFLYDYYQFYGNYFLYANESVKIPFRVFHQKRFSFSVPEKNIGCEAIQTYNPKTKQFDRFYNMRKLIRVSKPMQIFNKTEPDNINKTGLDNIDIQLRNLENFTNDIPMIGSYLTSKQEILYFLRIEDDINYCTLNECERKEYKILISCPQKVWTTFVRKIWPFVVITVVALVVFVTIAAIVIYLMKRSKTKKVKYELQSASTVNTLNSETGLPLHPSKVKAKPKKVSPKKRLQTPTKPGKPKVETKPKKSPKTKK